MDTFRLIAAERRRLADELADLTPAEWERPSLCGEWTNHEVAAHLNVPFLVKLPSFAFGLAKAKGDFDLANARFAKDLAAKLDPAECVASLRAHADHRFKPPGFGPEAPLTDVVVHGADLLRPLGRAVAVAPEALAKSLVFVLEREGGRGFPKLDIDDLHFEPTDVDVSGGHGSKVVHGPALSMIATLLARTTFDDDLTGPGADLLRERLLQ